MRIKGLSLKDWFTNIYLKYRFIDMRSKDPDRLKNFSPKDKPGYVLTFNDDFDKVSWGDKDVSNKDILWGIGEDWGEFHPKWLNAYFGPPRLGDDSCAIFSARYAPKKFMLDGVEITIPYVTSWLNTTNTFRQQYGRFECRMTLPKEKGAWPAFWLWGPTWPPEIDIIEAYGNKTGKDIVKQEITLHWRKENSDNKYAANWKTKIDDYDDDLPNRFHEFVLEWDENGLHFYTDGIKIYQFTDKKVLDLMYNKKGMEPFVLVNQNIMRLIDGTEGADYYSEFKVDYVRVYKKIK